MQNPFSPIFEILSCVGAIFSSAEYMSDHRALERSQQSSGVTQVRRSFTTVNDPSVSSNPIRPYFGCLQILGCLGTCICSFLDNLLQYQAQQYLFGDLFGY